MRRDERSTGHHKGFTVRVITITLALSASSMTMLASNPEQPAAKVEASSQQLSVPEPASLVLFGAGLFAVARHVRRKRQQAANPQSQV